MQMNMQMDLGAGSQPVAAAPAEEFDLETTLEGAEFYLNPDATAAGTFTTQPLSGTYGGLIECTGNGSITEDVDAFGTDLPGIIGGGVNSGHGRIDVRDTGDTADAVGGDFMAANAFWLVAVVQPTTISTNSGDWFSNDAVFRTSGGTFGVTLRSTPVVHAGGDTGLGQITAVGPAVTVGSPNVISVRKDGTNLYVSVNGGTETETACGDLSGMVTDPLKLFNDTAFENTSFAGILGKAAIFKTPPDATTRTNVIDALKTFYGIA